MEAHVSDRGAATTNDRGSTTSSTTHSTGGFSRVRRLATETKQAFKTTEFWTFVVVALGILISAAAISGNGDLAAADEFLARQAWLYVAIVAGAYLISRGLAKSGSSEPYTDDDARENGNRH